MAEYNLIQAPELLRRLANRLGLRQAHITPSLNEGVQSVVILDDLTDSAENPEQGQPDLASGTIVQTSIAGNDPFVQLLNRASAGPPLDGQTAGSTIEVVKLELSGSVAGSWRVGWRDDAVGTLTGAATVWLDSGRHVSPVGRVIPISAVTGFQARQGDTTTGTNIPSSIMQSFNGEANKTYTAWEDAIVMAPGSGIAIQLFNVGVSTLTISYLLRVRPT